MKTEQIYCMLNIALDVFYKRDKRLIEIGGLERTCAARIAEYLQRLLDMYGYTSLSADCEYGKATDDSGEELIKYLTVHGLYAAKDEQKGRVFPDIIVHKRGTHTDNLLVIELKGYWHNDNDWCKDEEKLKKFTHEYAPSENLRSYFRYESGVFIALGKKEWHFVRFRDGCQVSSGDSISDLFNKGSKL